ncbi:fimbrial protein [Zestomonas carbonaria]|uniref:Fimbrial-type adhesion domain-containing protein n=1 Tax=Zestomonas carbonaria TaxID=2762745 RepID=A0A7U7EMX2_9GAMM|nr:fimbrial protein [Pseudomonas carbonaria]CAD5107944.1 hypothetical protein PSEWESI4_02227 [Pseudomonas carbonaria]
MKKFLWLLVLLAGLPSVGWSCTWGPGGAGHAGMGSQVIALPSSLTVPPDSNPVGTVLWKTNGWSWVPTGRLDHCSAGTVIGQMSGDIGPRIGNSAIHETNVPGIGIAVFWCNLGASNCSSDPLATGSLGQGQLWAEVGSLNWSYKAGHYDPFTQFMVYLVKTGDISPGILQVGGKTSVFYGGGQYRVSDLTFSGVTTVTAPACLVDSGSQNITVALPTVAKTDFTAGSPVLTGANTGRAFSIDMTCNAGAKVNYRIDGNTVVPNVLGNATGEGMAAGVSVQLFRGGLDSNMVQPLATKLLAATTVSEGERVRIPLTARYYRTGAVSDISSGLVSTTATFTLFYE